MVITSPRCAQAVIKCLADSKIDENWLKKPVFVVGEATSRLIVKELDLKPIGADSGNAMTLIPTILKCNVLLLIKRKNNQLFVCNEYLYFIFR